MSKRDECNCMIDSRSCVPWRHSARSPQGSTSNFATHMIACEECRRNRQDYLEILHEHLPLVAEGRARRSPPRRLPLHESSYKQRFLQRTEDQNRSRRHCHEIAGIRDPLSELESGRWYRPTGMARYALPVAAGLLVAAFWD